MAEHLANGSDMGKRSRAQKWLSRSLSSLFDTHAVNGKAGSPPHFDVVIVGSGYGGAIAAASLAGDGARRNGGRNGRPRIAVLERGSEYLPGSFPTRMAELPRHVRYSTLGATEPAGFRDGLFDVRVAADIVTVVANGVGGGSLINAGVMMQPKLKVLTEARWPREIRSDPHSLLPFYDRASQWLGAGSCKQPNIVRAGQTPSKHDALKALGGAATVAVPITVTLKPGETSSAGVAMSPCIGCGDCATGCNHGAKVSLDVSLLFLAFQRGVEIYTGATVLRLERQRACWSIVVNYTDGSMRQRQEQPLRIEADRVILAAGTFGSTEILFRSRHHGLCLSDRLGQQFSGNGDLFAAAYDLKNTVNAVATEWKQPKDRSIGPTITGAIEHRSGDPDTDLSIQELAVPGALRQAFEEIFTTARTLHSLARADFSCHTTGGPDRNAVDHDAFDRTLPLALIGRDRADGELLLARGAEKDDCGDGAVHVRWPGSGDDPRFDAHHETAAKLLPKGSQLLPNPAWKMLPTFEAETLEIGRGPLLSVHPLGGCPMGDDARSGVVNHLGQVFTANPKNTSEVHPGLVVLDGSIVPTSLGINPALTIAALALRAIEGLRNEWGLAAAGLRGVPADHPAPCPVRRPVFRVPPDPTRPAATEVQLIERLRGDVTLADHKQHHLELTLHSHPVDLGALMSPKGPRRIDYDRELSVMRVFDQAPSAIDEDPRAFPVAPAGASEEPPAADRRACRRTAPRLQACARVGGSLDVMRLAPSWFLGRMWRALPTWLMHRGMRDIFQEAAARFAGLSAPGGATKLSAFMWAWKRAKGALAVSTRAGTARTLDYSLRLSDLNGPDRSRRDLIALFGRAAGQPKATLEARGRKTLTYDRSAGPWVQLMELSLTKFPGLRGTATLRLDLPYLARQGVPLLRVVRQQDHVQALADLASFHLYALRTILDGHMWSFRLPDRVPDRPIRRLPGVIPDMPVPDVKELKVADVRVAKLGIVPVHLRLTRYRRPHLAAGQPPVLLIHGYSASGTTFAHHTIPQGLARQLVDAGRDVWILDLRSSAGMPLADYPWTFEQVGFEDIPLAVEYVVNHRDAAAPAKVDVVAHCMGSAMLSMALLGNIPPGPEEGDAYPGRREAMRKRIRRIVLCQVGPLVVMSPTNQARAFVMRYVQQLLPTGDYRFRPAGEGNMADKLLDRLLVTLPYSREEFRAENPARPWARAPWVRTRHRIDALYGQAFKLANLSDSTLDYLDDFFGPMSVKTVTQVIHFARTRAITDRQGNHRFATPDRLREWRRYEILSIHGEDNGLVDISTAYLLKAALDPRCYEARCFCGFGHQDILIGKNAGPILAEIVKFLGKAPAPARPGPGPRRALRPAPPQKVEVGS